MDRLRALNWRVVVFSLAVSLTLLFSSRWLVARQTVETPLAGLLAAMPAVSQFNIDRQRSVITISVALGDVPQLAEAYHTLDRGVAEIMGATPFRIAVTDHRSPALNDAYYRVNPLVQEAMATGRYGGLVPDVEAAGAALGLDRTRVDIDARHVYLQLHLGSDYLYAVFERPEAGQRVGDFRPGGEAA